MHYPYVSKKFEGRFSYPFSIRHPINTIRINKANCSGTLSYRVIKRIVLFLDIFADNLSHGFSIYNIYSFLLTKLEEKQVKNSHYITLIFERNDLLY